MSIQKVLKARLYLVSSLKFVGTECLKFDGNNSSSPGKQGSIKDSALKLLYFTASSFITPGISLANCMGGSLPPILK
mgnify:CR=1 FL=1